MWLVFKVNVDLWSKATIRKYLPPEAKDPKKQQADKSGGEERRRRRQCFYSHKIQKKALESI
jgi:hypothetical protein